MRDLNGKDGARLLRTGERDSLVRVNIMSHLADSSSSSAHSSRRGKVQLNGSP